VGSVGGSDVHRGRIDVAVNLHHGAEHGVARR
jgi:hypothetical protein